MWLSSYFIITLFLHDREKPDVATISPTATEITNGEG
ncbi:MAG: hypothetical protein A4E53_00674 [Pelotomaculum sp. PtaB.Bin104]|nr:MAG: hypothetical protein A4E53_00674 [Pelotomaculum sp. PtaB.Bin104]